MTRIFNRFSNFTIVSGIVVLLCGAIGSAAAAQNNLPAQPSLDVFSSEPSVPANQADASAQPQAQPAVQPSDMATQAASLADLIAQQKPVSELSPEMNCLAGAIYFEARNQVAEGQLAVGRVIVARTKSGRFPSTYCGVVLQPSQFSFVRHHAIPSVDHDTPEWKQAVAIAKIAVTGGWQSPAEGALFFHTSHVAPGWHLHRVAQIESHIFYQ